MERCLVPRGTLLQNLPQELSRQGKQGKKQSADDNTECDTLGTEMDKAICVIDPSQPFEPKG